MTGVKLEEELRTNQILPSERRQAFMEVACLYSDLGQDEKALELLKRTLRIAGRPDAGILNQMGICAGRIGDHNREETFYREAAAATFENYPLFNLALAQKRNGLLAEAVQTAEEALERERDAPML